MANKKTPEAAVERLSPEEIAEIVGEAPETNDLTRTGRNLTEVRSETKVIDRKEMTEKPVLPESEMVEKELDGGTVLRTYMAVQPAPKGEDE